MSSLLTRQDQTTDKLENLFSNAFSLQSGALGASLGVSIGFSVALALLFSFLRPRHNLVYAPRAKYAGSHQAPPPMGKGPFAWIKPVIKTKEDVLVDTLGLDAAVFLRFTRMLRNIFCILGVLGVAIMLPVNITTGVKSIQDKNNLFAIMTPVYTFGHGMWAQVVVTWAVDLVILYFMWHNYRKVHDLRRAYFNSPEYQGSLHARSVLIRHIPSKMRSEEGILRLVEEVNPTGSLPIPIAMRNVKDIPELVEKHEEMVRKLESILAKYLKYPDRLPTRRPMMKPPKRYSGPTMEGGKVDAIDYYRRQIEVLEQNIHGMRQQVDQRDVMSFGFASWDHVAQAHIVAHAARRKKPQGAKIRPAPRPNDIIWRNMTLTKAQLRRKAITNGVWTAVLTLVWTPINACLAIFVSNLGNLAYVWEGFQPELQRHKSFWAFFQGIASPAITSGIYLLLPIIFRRLQVRAGDVTKTERERHVLRNLFNFFILNNLLIFSLFSAIWKYVVAVINDNHSGDVWEALRNANIFEYVTLQLCLSISPFWVTWILQRNLGAVIDLAQVWILFYQWFAKTFLAPTPRQYIEWTAPQQFGYAAYYNYFLFYTAVSISFATVQPLILVCTAVYFSMDSVLKKYLLMYVFVTKTESGGQVWKTLINRMIFSCILANCLIAFIVTARGYDEAYTMLGAMAPLPVIMLGFKWYCVKTFDPEMDFYQRDPRHADEHAGIEPSSKSVNRAAHRYKHPALDKKLITPMVPAKAKHIVQQIYAGRLDSEVGHGSADIPMEPMKTFGRPQSNMPFETVPEGQQDFQFYKNRSDFGEVGGDRLSKMGDTISRPGTPGSLASGTQTPYYDSRPGSPALGLVRKEVGSGHHQTLRSQTSRYSQLSRIESNDGGDISLHPAHGPYTDPNDDRVNLLRDVDEGRHPNDEFLTMDQWRTPGEPYTPGRDPGGYEYFRSTGMTGMK